MATTTAPLAPAPPEWQVDLADCPLDSIPDAVRFAVRLAVLAPSTHNAQPWRFRLAGDDVDVLLDTSRGLPVTDPVDREAHISLGAAVLNLRVALARVDLSCRLHMWPEPLDPGCVLRVCVDDTGPVETSLGPLYDAITRRHTSRVQFTSAALPAGVLSALRSAAVAEGATLRIITAYADRHRVAEAVADADRRQMSDLRFRRELSAWLRVSDRTRDGIHGYGPSHTSLLDAAAPLLIRTFRTGEGRAARDHEIAAFSPALALLTTTTDDRTDWLRAGQALERVLLRATLAGVSAGFLDQPIEVPELRSRTAALFGTDQVPQILLRLGYGAVAKAQRRRAVEQVIEA